MQASVFFWMEKRLSRQRTGWALRLWSRIRISRKVSAVSSAAIPYNRAEFDSGPILNIFFPIIGAFARMQNLIHALRHAAGARFRSAVMKDAEQMPPPMRG